MPAATSPVQMNLSALEIQWLLERRVTRLTDNKEVQIYPMGAERFLSAVLAGDKANNYPLRQDIEGKDVLLVPGFGNTSFLFAEAGAKSVTVYDKDPVTIAWVKSFKLLYHYRETIGFYNYPSIGELLHALTGFYPPYLKLPSNPLLHKIAWLLRPNALRRSYIHYILDLVQGALQSKKPKLWQDYELQKNIFFHTGTLDDLVKTTIKPKPHFDLAYVPYLLGVKNGIESPDAILGFMEQLFALLPKGQVFVNPSQGLKEFHYIGKQYFETSGYPNIQSIPGLAPHFVSEDKHWFRTQGLAIFKA